MSDFEAVYRRLRGIMLEAAGDQVVTTDEPGNLVVRTVALDSKTGQPGWFGTVTIRKSYVAYHLMPLYDHPELGWNLSDALGKRRQGKTCFNFARVDEPLFAELLDLSRRANEL